MTKLKKRDVSVVLTLEIIFIALVAVAVLATLAQCLGIPYPVLLVLGGVALGFVPGLPRATLQPDLVFLLFVPLLVLSAAWRFSWRDLRANLGRIVSMAVGLVIATMLLVAVVARWLMPDLTWPAAFVLGAIISATDPTALIAIAERMRVPRQVLGILEGEGLGNDATSLVAYRMAIAAVVVGIFSLTDALIEFLIAAVIGIALGLGVAYFYEWLQRRIDNPSVEVMLTLLLPFAAYIPADALGASGVLAVVAAGLHAGQRDPAIRSSYTRLQAAATWDTLVFILNGLIFILLGLQLPIVFAGVAQRPTLSLARDAAIVIVTVILVRIVWAAAITGILWTLRRTTRVPAKPLPWDTVSVIAWAGMRGADTLVIALAVPLATNAGIPFADHALIIFLTFCVVVVTLVVEGLSLPVLIRRVGLRGDDSEKEVARTRAAAHAAAVRHIDEGAHSRTPSDVAAQVRDQHEHLAQYFAARSTGGIDGATAQRAEASRQLRRDVVQAERREIIAMHDRGEISDSVIRTVLHDLDLEEQLTE